MPNYVQNKLRVLGPKTQVKAALESIRGVDTKDKKSSVSIDFNKIIPMPESLHVESGSRGEIASRVLFGSNADIYGLGNYFITQESEDVKRFREWSIKDQKEAVDIAFTYKENKEKYGYTTWYHWAIDKWGTKWNACDVNDKRDTEDTIWFQTAWNAPIPVIGALSKKFPKLTFELFYADEDTGSNAGWFRFKGGESTLENQFENGSNEAFEMAFELNPHSKEDYKMTPDGHYEYNEETED